MIKNEIFLLVISAVVILGILFILLGYLIIRKWREIQTRKKIEDFKENLSLKIYSYLSEGRVIRDLVPDSLLKQIAISELLGRYTDLLEGKEEKQRVSEFAENYLKKYYHQLLSSRRWSKRMNALYHIEEFTITSLLNEVLHLSEKERSSKDEIIHSLRILASFEYEHLYTALTQKHSHLSEFEYRNILMRIPNHLYDQFIEGFHHCQTSLQYAVLDAIGLQKKMEYLPFLESMYANSSGEIKIRALKSLAAIGYVNEIEAYMPSCQAPQWQERMMVAKLFGETKEKVAIPCLIRLLHDSSWWVRSQAGQSIMQFPNGERTLREVLETSKDPFARDMAWEWINKGEVL
ncbi:HEAT repeat domain-containing protein [Cytobacillus spongiae]|uniref:HEAT repeat domain-containing protein n=1 Tax=Cytobacillus spongiae TaxID=2901381 RepID=UPI001F1BF23B|nr:HEAT repeat domain-containing protein [Cytobacillus spongiae]UII56745.1 HEAT repeat domain-containing protein [Cytobacillus spongiae]